MANSIFVEAGSGNVTGPASSTDAGFAKFDGTTGELLKNSAAVVIGADGGTGVANTGKTVTLAGNLATSGAHNVTFTLTADSNVTLPTTGTLAAQSAASGTGTVISAITVVNGIVTAITVA